MRRPPNYWTYDKCKEVALTCDTRTEFNENFVSAYNNAWKFGWLDEICGHMKIQRKPKNYWNFDNCKEVSLLAKTRFEFSRKFSRAYVVSQENNWIDSFFPKNKKNEQ